MVAQRDHGPQSDPSAFAGHRQLRRGQFVRGQWPWRGCRLRRPPSNSHSPGGAEEQHREEDVHCAARGGSPRCVVAPSPRGLPTAGARGRRLRTRAFACAAEGSQESICRSGGKTPIMLVWVDHFAAAHSGRLTHASLTDLTPWSVQYPSSALARLTQKLRSGSVLVSRSLPRRPRFPTIALAMRSHPNGTDGGDEACATARSRGARAETAKSGVGA